MKIEDIKNPEFSGFLYPYKKLSTGHFVNIRNGRNKVIVSAKNI